MGKLIIHESHLPGAAVIETITYEDQRGCFNRFFCSEELSALLDSKAIVAVNFSATHSVGTVRGLHFQKPPYAEIKMVRCLRGKVFDVMVDIRKFSPTFLQWHGEILTPENRKMMFVPERFAHGFQVLEPDSELLYLHTTLYSKEYESGIRFDDSIVGVKWPLSPIGVSDRDQALSCSTGWEGLADA